MPAVATISVNFASLSQITGSAVARDSALSNQISINPVSLTRYMLYDAEHTDTQLGGPFKLLNNPYLKYRGGFLTTGDKLNVKDKGNLIVRDSVYVNTSIVAGPYRLATGESAGETIGRSIAPMFSVDSKSGNVITEGTTSLRGNLNVGSDNEFSKLIVDSTTGDTIIRGTTRFKGNLTIDSKEITLDDTRKFHVESTTGNTETKGTLAVRGDVMISPNSKNTVENRMFHIESATGNTKTRGTLTVVDDVTLNKNVTIAGSTTAESELFKITDGATDPVVNFQVDSANGNTDIKGTVDITGSVTLKANVTIAGSTTAESELFKITDGATPPVTKFQVDSANGNTVVQGTLDVTNNVTLNKNVTIAGSTTDSLELFKITDGATSPVIKFQVDSANGNTIIQGTLDVTDDVTLKNNVTITGKTGVNFIIRNSKSVNMLEIATESGNTIIQGTVAVTDNVTLNKNVTIAGSTTPESELFKITDGAATPLTKFQVDSANGNTTIQGTLDVTDDVTLKKNVTIAGSTINDSELFKITDGAASPVVNFQVDSANGNTGIRGTLTVTDDVTLKKSVTIAGSTAASSELFKITDGAATPLTKFQVDSANGNTIIQGTLDVAKNLTVAADMVVRGDFIVYGANTKFETSVAITSSFKIDNYEDTIAVDITQHVADKDILRLKSENKVVFMAMGGSVDAVGICTETITTGYQFDVSGKANISDVLTVGGITTLNNSLNLNGTMTLKGSDKSFIIQNDTPTNKFTVAASSGDTTIGGILTVAGATTCSSTLTVTGITTLNNSLNLNGTMTLKGSDKSFIIQNDTPTNKFTVAASSGDTSVGGTLTVAGATTCSSTLTVTGMTTLYDSLSAFSTISVSNNINLTNSTEDNRRVTNIRPVSRNEILGSETTYHDDPLPVGSFLSFLAEDFSTIIITSNHTLSNIDHNRTYVCSNNSGNNITIYCPSGLRAGLQVSFIRSGEGTVTFARADEGATVNSALGFKKLAFTNSAGTVYLGKANTYYLFGDLLP